MAVRVWEIGGCAKAKRGELGLRLAETRIGCEQPEDLDWRSVPADVGAVQPQRRPQVMADREPEPGRHDPDDGVGDGAELHGAADDAVVAGKPRLPEVV